MIKVYEETIFNIGVAVGFIMLSWIINYILVIFFSAEIKLLKRFVVENKLSFCFDKFKKDNNPLKKLFNKN